MSITLTAKRHGTRRTGSVRKLTTAVVCSVICMVAGQLHAQSSEPVFPNPGKVGMSREQQRQLGLQVAAQVYKQMPVLPDTSEETKYIRQLGEKLVATIPSEYSWPFEFHVVAQKEINAFALPGGPMFVNIGTITAAANEAQLAGVMAHEMSHVIMQHSAKQAGKAQTTGIIAGIAGAVLGGVAGGAVGQLGQMGIQMGAQGLMMKYSRGDETQADEVGAVILYKAGYNPQSLADFFRTLESEGGPSSPQWLSDHPNPGNREKNIEQEIRNWPPEKYATDSPAFQRVREHARTVRAYTSQEIAAGAKSGQWAAENRQNGAVFNGGGRAGEGDTAATGAIDRVSLEDVLPANQMVTASVGPIAIRRPENWQVHMPRQRGEFVTIAPDAGITANGIGYGVLISDMAGARGARGNIDGVTAQLVRQMQQNNGVEPLGDAQPITVAGVEGRSVMLKSTSPFQGSNGQPQQERDWLVTVPERNGSIIFMVFIAPESDFRRFQPTYQAMLKSIQMQ